MKTYIIRLSKKFEKTHTRAGEPTHFAENLLKSKIHTVRGNYQLWCKRFAKIKKGEACISIRQWEGRPFNSKLVELARLTKEDGIGLQVMYAHKIIHEDGVSVKINDRFVDEEIIAKNDGLDYCDWKEWFKDVEGQGPFAIIHFTPFRYGNDNN